MKMSDLGGTGHPREGEFNTEGFCFRNNSSQWLLPWICVFFIAINGSASLRLNAVADARSIQWFFPV